MARLPRNDAGTAPKPEASSGTGQGMNRGCREKLEEERDGR